MTNFKIGDKVFYSLEPGHQSRLYEIEYIRHDGKLYIKNNLGVYDPNWFTLAVREEYLLAEDSHEHKKVK